MISMILFISCLTFSCFGMDLKKEIQNSIRDRDMCLEYSWSATNTSLEHTIFKLFCEETHRNRLKEIELRMRQQELARKKTQKRVTKNKKAIKIIKLSALKKLALNMPKP